MTTRVGWASDGPALLTTIWYSPSSPAVKGPSSVLVMLRSALVVEVSVVVLVLLPAAGSGVEELTVAVLLIDWDRTSLARSTVRVTTLAPAPATIEPSWVQVTAPELAPQDQPLPVALT